MAEVFRIEIQASPRQAQAGIQSVEGSLEQLNRTATSTNALLRNALQIAGVSSGIVLVKRAADGLREYADTYVQVQNQLSVVTKGTAQLEDVTSRLLGVANRSRNGFEATAQLYSRTALATRELGVSQADLVGITETVNKAIILSGASAKEANNGLIQLSQAIASNRLAGDELRSVLEQLPVVADVIAKQLGVTRGELRGLGQDGKITAQVILDGFRNAREEIERRFAKTVPTVAQSLTVLRNNAIVLVGELNKITGASSVFAQVLATVGFNLKNLIFLLVALASGFAAVRLTTFVQGLTDAVRVQRAFAAEIEAGIAGPEAAALALENEARAASVAAAAQVREAEASLLAARASQAQAVAIAETSAQTLAGVAASGRAAAADLRRAEAATLVAQAELARAEAEGVAAEGETVLFGLGQELLALDAARAGAVQRLAASELELAAATAAATAASQGRAAAAGEIAALEATLAARTTQAAEAQAALNMPLAVTPTLFARIGAAIAANPIGLLVVGLVAVIALLGDLRDLAGTAGDGVKLLVEGFFALTTRLREFASTVPTVGKGLQDIIKSAIVFGGATAALLLAPVSPLIAVGTAVVALVIGLGNLKRAWDSVTESQRAAADARAIAPIGEEILQNQIALRKLNAELERTGSLEIAGAISRVKDRLVELAAEAKKIQGTDVRQKKLDQDFEDRATLLRNEIELLGKSRRERELGLEVLREEERFKKENKREVTPEQDTTFRSLIAQRDAAKELAEILDGIHGPSDDFLRQTRLLETAFDAGRISAEDFNKAVSKLEQENIQRSPFAQSIGELQRTLRSLSIGAPQLPGVQNGGLTGAAAQLEDLRAANRERAIEVELAQRLDEARRRGATDAEIAAQTPLIEGLVRENAARQRALDLQEQQLTLQRDLQNQATVSLLPDFDKGVAQKIQALQDLNLSATDQAARSAEIRRNASLEELGGILNGLQQPLLAQAQEQERVNEQLARADELQRTGAISAQQYATVLQELNFRAQEVSTTFVDGFSVALQKMTASLNEAAIGQQTFTGAISLAGEASAQFARQGTIDIRGLALNFIAELSKMITQLLILKAIQGLSSAFGPSQAGKVAGPISPDEFAGNFHAQGGSVSANQPVVVGEAGTPELFVPGRAGTILNSDQVSEALSRAGSGGGGRTVVQAPAVHLSIVNSVDPDMALHAMDTPAGARVVLNHIDSNPTSVKRSIGG